MSDLRSLKHFKFQSLKIDDLCYVGLLSVLFYDSSFYIANSKGTGTTSFNSAISPGIYYTELAFSVILIRIL